MGRAGGFGFSTALLYRPNHKEQPMRRTVDPIPTAPGPQFMKDPTTGQLVPNTILFTDHDKKFLASINWSCKKVVANA